jgi:hypothetical protein
VLSSVVSPSLFVHSIPSDQFHNLSDTSIDQGLDLMGVAELPSADWCRCSGLCRNPMICDEEVSAFVRCSFNAF